MTGASGRVAGEVPRPDGCAASRDRLPADPVRIGFVLHNMEVAGAEMLVAEIVRRLSGQIAPTIFCLDGIGTLGDQLRAEGVPVLPLGRRPGRDYRVAWRLARAIRSRRVEVVHAHQYTPFFYAALAKLISRGTSFRLILTEHGRAFPDVVSPLRRAVNRRVLGPLADAITGVCGFSTRALAECDGFPAGRMTVVTNGVLPGRYGPSDDQGAVRRRLGLDPARRYVTCVARFHPVKDHPTLLLAFGQLAVERADVDLLLVGDGASRGELAAQAEGLGISDRIRFLGVRQDVPDLLRAADIFAMTSRSEAASLTLLEAMATGLPVVVTAVGGNPEIVRDGIDGLLVPSGDAAATAEAMRRLLDDPDAAGMMGRSARDRVHDCYRLESAVAAYAGLYNRLGRREAAGRPGR